MSITPTFSIENRKFRLLKHTQSKDRIVQYFEKGIWKDNIDIKVYDQFETYNDWNFDGFNDIFSQTQGWNYINYYLPRQKKFSKQYKLPADDLIIIDSLRRLYANFREPYHQCNNFNSQLIDYTETVPKIHYLLSGTTFRYNGNCIIDSIESIELYSFDNKNDSLIFLRKFKPKNPKKFEYQKFWKDNYKRLMGYS